MFYDKFVQLCTKKGVPPTKVAAEIGLNKSAASGWKKGATPTDVTIRRLAEYFDVDVDYFLGRVDKYGLSTDDWRTISGTFVSYMQNAGKTVSDLVDGRTISSEQAEAFILGGAPLEPVQLTLMCGMMGISAPDVFAKYADNLWPERPKKTSAEDDRGLEKLRNSPATRALLHTISDMTEEQIASYDNFIRSMRGFGRKDD